MATQSFSRSGCCGANLINTHENGNSKNDSADRTFFHSTSSAPDQNRNDMGILNPDSSIRHFPNGQAYIAELRIPVWARIEKPMASFPYLPLLKPHLNTVLAPILLASTKKILLKTASPSSTTSNSPRRHLHPRLTRLSASPLRQTLQTDRMNPADLPQYLQFIKHPFTFIVA